MINQNLYEGLETKNNRLKFQIFFVYIVIGVLVAIVSGIVGYTGGKNLSGAKKESTTMQPTTVVKEIKRPELSFFTDKIQNFEQLKLENLPNFVDYRYVYKYGANYILVGYNRIVEVNEFSREIVRLNDLINIKTISDGLVVGNYLYVSGSRDSNTYNSLFKINLDNGEIVKEYKEIKSGGFINLSLVSKDEDVWASFWGGSFRLNTKSDEFKLFSWTDMGLKMETCPMGIGIDSNNRIMVNSNCVDLGVTVYDEETGFWNYRKIDNEEHYRIWSNEETEKKGKNIYGTYFIAISDLVDGKYLLFANNGIYTLEKGGLPKLYKSAELPGGQQIVNTKVILNKNRSMAIIMGGITGMDFEPFVYKIDMVNGHSDDLTTLETSTLLRKVFLTDSTNLQGEFSEEAFYLTNQDTAVKLKYNFANKIWTEI